MSDAQAARQALNGLLQDVLDAETGQRGFLLTGEARYREPYDTSLKDVDGNLARSCTSSSMPDRPDEHAAPGTRLADHVARKLSEMEVSVRLRQSGSEDAWKFVLTTDVGREEMNAIRSRGQRTDRHEQPIPDGGPGADQQVAPGLARLGIALVALAGLLFAFWLYLRQTHALRLAGERQQEALQHERNALEAEVSQRTATLAELLATHLQNVRETGARVPLPRANCTTSSARC